MNFELGGHIVWIAELKKKNIQKVYNKPPQEATCRGKHLGMQRMDPSLRAVHAMDCYAKGCCQGQVLAHSEQTSV